MTKDVMISIRGLQFMEGEDGDDIETVQQGEYYEKNGADFLLYDEYLGRISGACQKCDTYPGQGDDADKAGILNVQMNFEVGKKTLTRYQTPYGVIMIGLDTTRVACMKEERCMIVEVDYTLEANYQYVADCRIRIKAAEKGRA